MKRISSGFLLLALAACSSEPEPGPTPRETVAAQAGAAESGEQLGSGQVTSQYQTFDLADCTETDRATEGESITWRCSGPGGLVFWAHDGDGRFDIDVGSQTNDFATIGAFNSIGDMLEWRMRDGRPYALIFRYLDATMENRGRTVLAIEKIAAAGQDSCRIAQIAGSTPDANVRARQIADDTEAGFECGRQGIKYVGDAR